MTRHYEGYARSLLEFQVVVFAALLVVGTALVISRGDSLDAVLFASGAGLITLVTVATLLWRHRTEFQRFSLVLPLLDIVGVRLAVLADDTLHSGGGLLLILPIIWIAYTFGPWGFAVCLVLIAATSPQSFFTGYADTDSFDFTRLVAYPLILIILALAAGVSGVRMRRKRAELAVQTLLTERAVQARDDLVEAVTHELRTPLTSILGNAELLGRSSGQPETVERRASVIVRNAEQMETILADLLVARSTETAPLALRRQPVDVRAIIDTSLAASRAAADAGGVTFDVTQLAPVCTTGDPHRIRQVFDNLFTNAIKYNRAGGTVTVTQTRDAAAVTFAVTDTGVGIAAVEGARVFEPYYRTEHARRSTQAGTGLGLGISRDIARRHGGDLRLAASSSTGSRFELTLPLIPSRTDADAPTGR
ncbi:MAG: HAMP domain-containing sensor histidine kinase [Cryobacterium sp.]